MLITNKLSLKLIKYPKTINALCLNEWFESDRENPIIVDVREKSELDIACFPKHFVHLPISKISYEYVQESFSDFLKKEIVVICHAGVRSYSFGLWLLENNLVREIWNLEGGIDGWSKYVNPEIPRY